MKAKYQLTDSPTKKSSGWLIAAADFRKNSGDTILISPLPKVQILTGQADQREAKKIRKVNLMSNIERGEVHEA